MQKMKLEILKPRTVETVRERKRERERVRI